jgi:hypothetical protein
MDVRDRTSIAALTLAGSLAEPRRPHQLSARAELIARAREQGLKIYGATLTPFEGTTFPGYYAAACEANRQAVNAWIRFSGKFDAVIDFDRALRDPTNPGRMLPAYRCTRLTR